MTNRSSVGIVGRYGHFEFGAGHIDYFNYAPGLIRYSTTHALEQKLTRAQMFRRALRPQR